MIEVVGALLLRDGRLLMGLRASHKRSFPECWDILGGHMEPGGTPAQTLVREIQEEAGVTPTAFSALESMTFEDRAEGLSTMHLFRVDAWTGGEPFIANDEHTAFAWMTPEEVQALPNLSFPELRTLFPALV
jgi:8-oxo-dGTP diphosphatase